MANGVIIQSQVQATNVDALIRNVVSASNIENGSVFRLDTVSSTSGEDEVFVATAPTTGSLTNLWMAAEPPVPITSATGASTSYSGIDSDPRNFINTAGNVFAAIKPQIGDIITLSSDAVGGTIGANTHVVATNTQLKLQWAAAAVTGLSLKLLETTYISIGTGAINNQRQTAYRFEVVAV